MRISPFEYDRNLKSATRGYCSAYVTTGHFYRQLNLPQIQKILQEFEKQSEIMDMKEEIMNDAIDDAMEDEGDEEER